MNLIWETIKTDISQFEKTDINNYSFHIYPPMANTSFWYLHIFQNNEKVYSERIKTREKCINFIENFIKEDQKNGK